MTTETNYLPASQDDLKSIVKLLEEENGDRENLSAEQFMVAKMGNELIGCVRIKILERGTAELASLVVKSSFRGQGIGKQLVAKILNQYKKRPVYLLCDERNAGFYAKNEFQILDPNLLPNDLKSLYEKILNLPFAKGMQISALICK